MTLREAGVGHLSDNRPATRAMFTGGAAPRVVSARLARRDALVPLLTGAIIAALLYFGRTVLIPIILSILLSFLLAPIVALLRRLGIHRVVAVLLTFLLALAAIGLTSAVIVNQAATMVKDAPAYAERITAKADRFRASLRDKAGFLLNESPAGGSGRRSTSQARDKGSAGLSQTSANAAIPVEIRPAPPTAYEEIKAVVGPVLVPLETALIVLIVTIFILLQKEDLRDRVIRLMGANDLHRTTIALDDAAKRLSRYFLSQFAVNCAFGLVIWIGLFFLGVPSPGLWGILAALLRFIPYIGSLIAALAPIALAAAIDPGWRLAISVALLFLIVEPIVGYVIEPMLYGHSTGLSPVSVVIAAIFWTWIWGPVGLVLSMPMTLMLVVLGRHIPALAFFDVLLGDQPALTSAETFYHRVLTGRADDVVYHADEMLTTMPLNVYYDEVALGGLRLAAQDVDRGAVERASMAALNDTTVEAIAILAEHDEGETGADEVGSFDPISAPLPKLSEESAARMNVLCIPGRGPLDPAVSSMLVQLVERMGIPTRELERMGSIDARNFDPQGANTIAIVGLFDDRAFRRVDLFAKRIRAAFPAVRVVVGVRRNDDQGPTGEGDENALADSLTELCGLITESAPTEG